MATQEQKAQAKAAQIERYGDTLTMADGVTTIRAIADVDPNSTRAAATQSILDDTSDRTLCLFHVTKEGFKVYMRDEGQTITRSGIKWKVEAPARNQSYDDTTLVIVLLASSGGNPA